VGFRDPFGLDECHQYGNCVQNARYTPDPAEKFAPPRNAAGGTGFGVAVAPALAPLGRPIKPVADRTTVGVEITTVNLVQQFASDGTATGATPAPSMKVMFFVTVAEPNTSTISPSIGADFGEGLLAGGSVELDGNTLAARGASLRLGVGVQSPAVTRLLDKLGIFSFTDGRR
jgi:hypothetical protein